MKREGASRATIMKAIHDLHIENKRGYLWITLPDSITMENYLQILNRIESEIIEKSELANKVIIDLSKIDSIHSLLIGLILHIRKPVKQNQGVFYLVNVSGKCLMKFQALFLDRILQIYENEEDIG